MIFIILKKFQIISVQNKRFVFNFLFSFYLSLRCVCLRACVCVCVCVCVCKHVHGKITLWKHCGGKKQC